MGAVTDVSQTLQKLARGVSDPWPLVDEVVGAALALDTPRGYDFYLVWTNFYDQTREDGGEAAAEAAMPAAASEWLAAVGEAFAEREYMVRWFQYHGLGIEPSS
jgi:hypothetical protein